MASIGSESVEIVPDARGFKEKLEAQLRNLPSVQIQLDSAAATSKIEAVKTQVRSIGSGRAKITADTADVDAKIAGIKAQIRSIQQNRVSVNIDTAKATADIAALRVQEKALKDEISDFKASGQFGPVDDRQLRAVQQTIADIQSQRLSVRVDTTEADAKLLTLRAELDAATRERTARINVDDNGVSSRLRGIADAADSAAVGTVGRMTLIATAVAAIIPLAAAASIAVAGIGAGIGLGIVGALVGKLALGGVGSALSASNTPSGGGQSQAQRLDQQRQAEVALTVAQRNALQAQRDLTQARIDAANALQNLTDQVADNGLAQRQAALDLQTATLNLATAKANPDAQNPANANALARVQLAYDQAKQNVQDLADAGSQLAQQQAQATAAGVDGAANVVAATNGVTDSQNALVEAQFNAAQSAQAAAGGLTAYQQAMAKLDPVQQNFVKFIQAIKPAFDQVTTAAADSFLPKLQTAITNLLPALPQISVIVGEIAGAFGDLAIQAANFFTSPDGTKFLDFVQSNIGPAIETFGQIFGGFFSLGVQIFEQAWPLIKQFGDGLAGALGDANKAVQGGALNGFFDYLKQNGPQIKDTLKTVGGALGSIFVSLAPLAGPALKVIGDLAKYLAEVVKYVAPVVKALIPLAPYILAVVAAAKLFALVMAAVDLVLDANPFVLLAIGVVAVVAGFIYAYEHFKTFRDIVNDILNYAIKPLIDYLVTVAAVEIKIFVDVWKATWDIFKGVYDDVIKPVFDGISAAVDAIPGIFNTAKSLIVSAWNGIWSGLSGIATSAFDGIGVALVATINGLIDLINPAIAGINDVIAGANDINPFSDIPKVPKIPHVTTAAPTIHNIHDIVGNKDGGLVTGPGTGTSDSIIRALSNGEFVVKADVAQRNLGALTNLNNGRTDKLGKQTPINVWPSAGMDEVAIAVAVGRRLQFAGA